MGKGNAGDDGKGFTKTDMERMGIFHEMGYITIGDNYKGSRYFAFNDAASKGKQMIPGGSKERSAHQHGYFEETFKRVLEGESYSDPIRIRRLARRKAKELDVGKPFLPSNGDKLMSGLGSYYGTIGGTVPYFNPAGKQIKAALPSGKNVQTNPGKKGTGYGYVGVTINPYQSHAAEDFDRTKKLAKSEQEAHRQSLKGSAFKPTLYPMAYFNENPYRSDKPLGPPKKVSPKIQVTPFKPSSPAKKPGGSMIGMFDPYPSHSVNTYKKASLSRAVHAVNNTGKTFMPNAGPKSTPVFSTVNWCVDKKVHKQNYKYVQRVMTY
ncbi:hypothetical protein NP493_498g02005 [Ridgeia piscesae]|uniref:Cilia-and flagella-associated protein 96 n=1 Tax=Ridgeia piscesae TaxID=27915 RepID=A0AAD9KX74_RIDPI|nr:hypothetical protein NP493_498g02005 [Ridgeia piscesae]